MSEKNKDVVALLDHYLDPKIPAGGAVLLTGAWGAGKTHFLKDYLKKRDAEAKRIDPLNARAHLYVSLYGISSLQEIQSQFFAQTNPVLSSGPVRLLGTAAARVLNTLTKGQGIKEDDAEALQKFLGRDLAGAVLVFDDLERSALPIIDVMGFINTFVEHDGAKAIVLASEADIPEEQRSAYRSRKEKLIAKSMTVKGDADAAYDEFLAGMRHEVARKVAADAKAAALRTFEASRKDNLRSLRVALEDFDRLVASIDSRVGAHKAAEQLLLTMIALAMELRSAALQEDEAKRLRRAAPRDGYGSGKSADKDSRHSELRDIAEKYQEVEWGDSVVPVAALAKLLVSGVLDVAEIDTFVSQHPLIVGPAGVPAWRRLWSWSRLSKSEYQVAKAEFLQDLASGSIVHPGTILHAVSNVIKLGEWGDDLLDGEPVVDYFRDYLERVESSQTLEPDNDPLQQIGSGGWGGLGFTAEGSEPFELVRRDLQAAVQRRLAEDMKARAPALLSQLRACGSHRLISEYGRGDPAFGGVAILHFIAPAEFAELCLQDGLLDESLIGALLTRYEMYGHSGALADEAKWLRDLRRELSTRASQEPPPFKSRLHNSIRYWFDKAEAALPPPPKPPVRKRLPSKGPAQPKRPGEGSRGSRG